MSNTGMAFNFSKMEISIPASGNMDNLRKGSYQKQMGQYITALLKITYLMVKELKKRDLGSNILVHLKMGKEMVLLT